MKLLAKIVAIITMAVMAIALPAGGGADLTVSAHSITIQMSPRD